MKQLIESIKKSVACEMDDCTGISDEIIMQSIEQHAFMQGEMTNMSLGDIEKIIRTIHNEMLGFGILQPLFDDSDISEIMVNGCKMFYESFGEIHKSDIVIPDNHEVMKIIRSICRKSGRSVNSATPITDACLKDGTRISIVLNQISVDGHAITIRKFPDNPITGEKMIEAGFISHSALDFLVNAYKARYNIFICGGAGSGKTTLLNVLANYSKGNERIITIEDSAELKITDIDNLVRLEARRGTSEGGSITIRELIKASLRMRPDRIIVGEVRGGEALDMLQAMNTGHEGSISTGHANSCRELLSRLETMVLTGSEMPLMAARNQILNAIDIIVCLGRIRTKRHVRSIVELQTDSMGQAEFNTLYEYKYDIRKLSAVGELSDSYKMRRFLSD